MRVGDQLLAHRFLAVLAAPYLRPGHEEALVAGQAVDHRGFLAVQRKLVGAVGQAEAAEVADVLAHRQLAVDAGLAVVERAEAVVLGFQLVLQLLEVGLVGRAPPVAQIAGAVGLRALVVEAVAHFVADHRADAAVIDRRIGRDVEERRLENGSREHDLVEGRVVVGVDRLGQHEPFGLVDRLADALHLVVVFPGARGDGVAERIGGREGQAFIGLERVRRADLGIERVELGLGFLAGCRAHPGQVLEVDRHGLAQIGDEVGHRGLGFGRVILLGIDLADQFTGHAFDRRDTALPAGALLGLAAHDLAVEGESGVVDVAGQDGGIGAQEMRGKPGLPGRYRYFRHQLGHGGHAAAEQGLRLGGIDAGRLQFFRRRRHLADEHVTGLARAEGVHESAHQAGRAETFELRQRQLVVGEVGIAACRAVPVGLGDTRFQREHGFGGGGRIGIARLAQNERQVFGVLGANVLRALVVLQVVVAVGQAEAADPHLEGVNVALLFVRADISAERRGEAGRREDLHQVVGCPGREDARQMGLRGREASLVDGVHVHEGGIGRFDAGGVGSGGGLRGDQLVHDRVDALFGKIAQRRERAPVGAVRRKDDGGFPFAVHELVEVRTGLGGLVLPLGLDPGLAPVHLGRIDLHRIRGRRRLGGRRKRGKAECGSERRRSEHPAENAGHGPTFLNCMTRTVWRRTGTARR